MERVCYEEFCQIGHDYVGRPQKRSLCKVYSLSAVCTSEALLTEISLRSPWELFNFYIKNMLLGSTYPKKIMASVWFFFYRFILQMLLLCFIRTWFLFLNGDQVLQRPGELDVYFNVAHVALSFTWTSLSDLRLLYSNVHCLSFLMGYVQNSCPPSV